MGGYAGAKSAQYATGYRASSDDISDAEIDADGRLSRRDRAYLDKYYDPVVDQAKAYEVDPVSVLGVGIESAFASDGTYLRTGDAFGMTGGSTKNMSYFGSPSENVTGWFNVWGRQVYGTGSDVNAFLNGLQGRDVWGVRVPGWMVYNSVKPEYWWGLVSSGIGQMRREIPLYEDLR